MLFLIWEKRPMIRLTRCTQASKAGLYFRLHLQPGDSDEGPIKPGVSLRPRWFGPGASTVGLGETTPPTASHLTRLGRGLHPTEKIRLAPSKNRKRAYYDLTISATKTISVAALLRPEHPTARLVMQSHIAAVEKVVDELRVAILPRSGSLPVRWIGVTFHHTHSREGDPHLHSHIIVPNIAQNKETQWRAIEIKIAGHIRQRLELRYGHELAHQLRLIGLGAEIFMRKNGLPELRSLRALCPEFGKAGAAIFKAVEAAGAFHPPDSAPAAGGLPVTGHSGLPVHPQRSGIRARQRLADQIRRPKKKESDDPTLLRDEAQRWASSLSTPQMRRYLDVLDSADPTKRRNTLQPLRPGSDRSALPPPPLKELILDARRYGIPDTVRQTRPVVFRAVMVSAAGRYSWEELRAAVLAHLLKHEDRLAKIRRQIEEDSVRAEDLRIRRANRVAAGLPPDPPRLYVDAREQLASIIAAVAAMRAETQTVVPPAAERNIEPEPVAVPATAKPGPRG